MNIPTITKEDFEADDILATLAAQGAEQGYRVLVVSGDRDTIQLVNDDVTLLYPNVRGVSELKRLRHRRGARALRHRAAPVPRDRRARRRDQRQPARHRQGRREDRRQVAAAVRRRSRRSSSTPTRSRASSATTSASSESNAVRNRRLNRLLTDVELPGRPGRPRAPADRRGGGARDLRPAAVPHAARPRAEAGPRAAAVSGSAPEAEASRRRAAGPAGRSSSLDEELANWLDERASADRRALGLAARDAGSRVVSIGFASRHARRVDLPGRPAGRLHAARGVARRARRPEDAARREDRS